MGTKLFVGNISFQVNDFELTDLFKEYGEVASAKVVTDKMTGRSRGFGFVEMSTEDAAQKAIDALNGQEVKGRAMNVSLAKNQGEEGGGSRGGNSGFDRPQRSYNKNY